MAKKKDGSGSTGSNSYASWYQGLDSTEDIYTIGAFGLNGSGKTFFTGSWKNVLYLDFDSSKRTLQSCFPGKKDILVFDFAFGAGIMDGLTDLLDAFEARKGPFKEFEPETIVVDSLTSLCVNIEKELIDQGYESSQKDKEVVSLGDYRVINNTVMTFINRLKTFKKNLILCARIEWYDDPHGQGRIYYPAVSGKKLPGIVMDSLDFLLWFKREGDKFVASYEGGEEFPYLRSRGVIKKKEIANMDMKKFLGNFAEK